MTNMELYGNHGDLPHPVKYPKVMDGKMRTLDSLLSPSSLDGGDVPIPNIPLMMGFLGAIKHL